MLKKILKYGLYGVAVLVLILVGLVIWFWESVAILTGNKNLEGNVESVPQAVVKEYPPITEGKADWPTWLGKKGDNAVTLDKVPTDWAKGLKKLWEVNFLCQGKSSAVWAAPVIKGNRLIACGRNDTDDIVFCLNPDDGSLIWQSSYPTKAGSSYGRGFRATPWIDNDRIYTFGRSGDVVCWNLLDGKKLWHKNVNNEGGKEPKWGFSSSPYVSDSLVIVDGGGTARTIAYDKKTGDVKWKCGSGKAGYAAITTMMINNQKTVLDFYGTGLAAVDLKTGKERWNVPWKTSYDVNATTPVFKDDFVFISSGYGTGCELLKVSETKADVVWKNKNIASHHTDPFIIDDHIYGYSGQSIQNKGSFKCLELKTGKEKWSTKEIGWGTTIKVNDYLLCLDIKGNLHLMKPNPDKFELVASLPKTLGKVKGAAWTKPIVANNRLYLRFMQKLICLKF